MGIAEIIGGIKTTYAAATTAIEMRDTVKLDSVKADMLRQLLELYTAAFDLVESNAALAEEKRNLERQITELREKADERAQYEPYEPYPGTTVMRRKQLDGEAQPGQYVCPGCLENRSIKSILQFNSRSQTIGRCHECTAQFRFADTPEARGTRGSSFWNA